MKLPEAPGSLGPGNEAPGERREGRISLAGCAAASRWWRAAACPAGRTSRPEPAHRLRHPDRAGARLWARRRLLIAGAATLAAPEARAARTVTLGLTPALLESDIVEEVAALTAFLLGPEASAITGQQMLICGGSSL